MSVSDITPLLQFWTCGLFRYPYTKSTEYGKKNIVKKSPLNQLHCGTSWNFPPKPETLV